MVIDNFEDEEFRWLSNFYRTEIDYKGRSYPTLEHAYQAAKTLDEAEHEKIRTAPNPAASKKLGRDCTLREDWEEIKISVMEELLRLKFNDSELKEKLLSTGDDELVEGNWWGDIFWGVCKGKGENNLGKLLMKIRGEYK